MWCLIFYGNLYRFTEHQDTYQHHHHHRRHITNIGHTWWFSSSVCKGLLLICVWVFVFHLHTCIPMLIHTAMDINQCSCSNRVILSLLLRIPNNNFMPLFQIYIYRYAMCTNGICWLLPLVGALPSSAFFPYYSTHTHAFIPFTDILSIAAFLRVCVCVCYTKHIEYKVVLLYNLKDIVYCRNFEIICRRCRHCRRHNRYCFAALPSSLSHPLCYPKTPFFTVCSSITHIHALCNSTTYT